ncbi:PREDICTED: protein zyg-11 homolog B-like [Nicrophorus vespilloides]|uniref:Protein zyg-11 homolog B-like n=1 Tax=Nicrophorus vespilloides TaxID=110193 RepID=A0ABM1M980_NICVS|nr:PREDICTED: protein zyg-11 homolog B-like [Nicrophorus vespilloides]
MYDNPVSLQELCLEYICEYYEDVFEVSSTQPTADHCFYNQCLVLEKRISFKDEDMYLFPELSEKLLTRFNEKNLVSDTTIHLFTGRNTKLRSVKIKNCRISHEGLKILREHKLSELQCINVEISIGKIIDCLNEYSLSNLTHLNVSCCTFIDLTRHSSVVQLTKLVNLRTLNVSFTEFNQQALQIVCDDLQYLERLDISGTCVQCIKPLLKIKDRLVGLVASDLHLINTMTKTIIELDSLRHLDISLYHESFESINNMAICDILENPDKLPNLIYLDISGWRDLISKSTLETYLQTHPRLKFLGVVLNPVAFEVFLSEPTGEKDLIIAGLGNEEQLKMALKKHIDRYTYVQKALYHLFQLSGWYHTSRKDVFQLVLPAMAAHPRKFGVQMAATACLYNLTRGEISKTIHPKMLSHAVHLTLNAMESFPDEHQLQKNGLLTLCSDRILQEVSFDRYRCTKLVLESLCANDEVNMNRMSVAICSILASKISTSETSELGAKPKYMSKLLAMVKERVESGRSDITLKFTLSALWNLTDESAATCHVFLENGGAELFLKVLCVFRNDTAVETKVLGLLNNIAEVEDLRSHLMIDALMNELFTLLKDPHIDVSYFASGIVAHLSSDRPETWLVKEKTRENMLKELEEAVDSWGIPDTEMVAYRTFRPFFPLLCPGMGYGVHLWAVWAIQHVCTKNPRRYCLMLREENGLELLENLLEDGQCHENVKNICSNIIDITKMTVVHQGLIELI